MAPDNYGPYEKVPVIMNTPETFPTVARQAVSGNPPLLPRDIPNKVDPGLGPKAELPRYMVREEVEEDLTKHWAASKTLWGAAINFFILILPIILKNNFGVTAPDWMFQLLGDTMLNIVQGTFGVIGTWLIIWGRTSADKPIGTKEFKLRI